MAKFTHRLTKKVKTFADVSHLGLLLRERDTSGFQEGVDFGDYLLFKYLSGFCSDDEVIRLSHKVNAVFAFVVRTPANDGFQAI